MMSSAHNGPPTLESLRFIEELWRGQRAGAESLPADWQAFFDRWRFGDEPGAAQSFAPGPPGFFEARSDGQRPTQAPAGHEEQDGKTKTGVSERRVVPSCEVSAILERLVAAFRTWGHLEAQLDPLGRPRPAAPQLQLPRFGLSEAALDAPVQPLNGRATDPVPLRKLIAQVRSVYCRTIGYQYMHLDDLDARRWLRRRIERRERPLSRRTQLRILNRLTAASGFEQFARKRYVGTKIFSLAGSESLVPLLDTVIERAGHSGMFEIVLGMAHRGRLNVLVNILGQRAQEIFRELEDQESDPRRTGGDVRYHLGYSTDWLSQDGDRIHLSLSFNPSHLEFVNPVALGRMRAKQQRAGDASRRRGMVVLLHGDASFIGEGVVQESLNLARLPGYTTGGTLHIVIDNQLGFTTDPREARSTTYASDIALAFGAPIFHVNGDDAEAVVRVARLAADFRQRFQRDVVIDLHCFRRWGHNESDEPAFTQPQMYRLIESHPSVRDLYERQLVEARRITPDYGKRLAEKYAARLQSESEAAGRTRSAPRTSSLGGVWSSYVGGPEPADDQPATAVPADKLKELLTKLIAVPEGFHVHHKLAQGLARRGEMIRGKRPLDWSACEALALASLAVEGRPIRLTGQDTARGTFSQRHAVWHDVENGSTYVPLANLAAKQAPVEVINSPLCETASLGFEYGFSLDYPEALVAWEAQFGDFWNAAQVIFDQFLASAEDKWSRLSGLVLLLPHGFEGQGPEHSSARLERFLASAANHSFQVVVPSTPAQNFHCLRRQVLRRWRKPLVILTPKSLLRHHEVVSSWEELEVGVFRPVIEDPRSSSDQIKRVLLCTGKLYYELTRERQEQGRDDVSLVRIEQFYPLPIAAIQKALEPYSLETPIVWCQEEPANMGAWRFLQSVWPTIAPARPPLDGVTRPESASPATGSHSSHRHEQQTLLARALA
jgi:2-oxoglutarate dehydrogenase E1 component